MQTVMFSRTLSCGKRPSRLRSSVTSATPARLASAGDAKWTSLPSSTICPDGGLGRRAEQALEQLGASGPHQTGDAQHFSPPQLRS